MLRLIEDESKEKELKNKYSMKFRNLPYKDFFLLSYSDIKKMVKKHNVSYKFKSYKNPGPLLYKIGKILVSVSPVFWRISNGFQIIIKKEVKKI